MVKRMKNRELKADKKILKKVQGGLREKLKGLKSDSESDDDNEAKGNSESDEDQSNGVSSIQDIVNQKKQWGEERKQKAEDEMF